MKAILPDLDPRSSIPLYIQLFEYIKAAILNHEIVPGEKLPSLRNLSETLEISITTTGLAYEQLEVEGYIVSRPRSGYYVSEIVSGTPIAKTKETGPVSGDPADFTDPLSDETQVAEDELILHDEPSRKIYDLSSFDFVKWKKCFSKILNDYPQTLLFESDPQGELALRHEIAKYVFTSRGVRCHPDQIAIAAGTQQLTVLLSTLLRRMGIDHVAVEDPGYQPVISSFSDRGFAMTKVPVASDGIAIEKLPANIRAAAYVNPSNQFPTGAVMPIARRYMLLDWAQANDSYIIEDDYDSELRYIGRPIPAMQGLDEHSRVIYLGSFSSTLFASIKISYMVMPQSVAQAFNAFRENYTQTCSKTEQLTLALFMERGYYQTGIKKMRRLYSQKLKAVIDAFSGVPQIDTVNTYSGINITLTTGSPDVSRELLGRAAGMGLSMQQISETRIIFSYNQIPAEDIPGLIAELTDGSGNDAVEVAQKN